jgi:hypothetical protein
MLAEKKIRTPIPQTVDENIATRSQTPKEEKLPLTRTPTINKKCFGTELAHRQANLLACD